MRRSRTTDYTNTYSDLYKLKLRPNYKNMIFKVFLAIVFLIVCSVVIYLLSRKGTNKVTFLVLELLFQLFITYFFCRYASCYFGEGKGYIRIKNEFLAYLLIDRNAGNGRNVPPENTDKMSIQGLLSYLLGLTTLFIKLRSTFWVLIGSSRTLSDAESLFTSLSYLLLILACLITATKYDILKSREKRRFNGKKRRRKW
ncbi:hypothetical protein [Anaeromicropila herbilytica]|uniref:Uncharacterized protein n=1 Tax=Anaeromicropila herbilytica TaxID=2785025 RepID=A0A7R7IAX4_9FIRM|nr:hypothetical protein [Anaeromicropila herbilytica]BCN28912.1 hypothetical protein bsdtb5_02070 [Anaeromicropila herbilytica]